MHLLGEREDLLCLIGSNPVLMIQDSDADDPFQMQSLWGYRCISSILSNREIILCLALSLPAFSLSTCLFKSDSFSS